MNGLCRLLPVLCFVHFVPLLPRRYDDAGNTGLRGRGDRGRGSDYTDSNNRVMIMQRDRNKTSRGAIWLVRRATDSRFLCVDGSWRHCVAGVDRIKFYASSGRAHRYGLRGRDGSAIAVYPNDSINRNGHIERGFFRKFS